MDANAYGSAPDSGRRERHPMMMVRPIVGLWILALGVLFLLDNFGVLDASSFFAYWPTVIILIGLVKLFNAPSTPDRVGALIWMGVGTWILLGSLDVVTFSIWRLWPVVLILFGLSMLRSIGGRRGVRTETMSRVQAFALMSGADRRVQSSDFQGGDATAIMGGCEIDLRQCDITNGPAVFDVVAFWGGIDIQVPPNWTVRNDGLALLGAIEDTRKETAGDPSKVLVVRGIAVMGGVEIKN